MILLKGKVKDHNGDMLPQVKVVATNSTGTPVALEGSVRGTITDSNGNYTLQVPDSAKYITAKSSLYASRVKTVFSGQSDYNFTMGGGVQDVNPMIVTASKPITKAADKAQPKYWNWLMIGGGGLILASIIIAVVVKKKKKNK